MDSNDYKSLVMYYGRSRFYNSMQKMALEGLVKFPMQPEFKLFNGVALALGNRMQECIRELNPLKNELEMGLASTLTLIYAHKHCRLIDREAVQSLEGRISDGVNSISAASYYYAAIFYYLISDIVTSFDYVVKAIQIDDNFDSVLILKTWCELSSCLDLSANGNIQNLLEGCISRSKGKNIDASLALVRFYQRSREFDAALSVINKLSIRFPELSILLIEKMDLQMSALDWDNSLDTSIRVINMESFNVAALRTKGVLHIVRESNIKAGKVTLQQLLASVERIEPGNHRLLMEICQLFSRICSRNFELLQVTLQCIEKVNQQNPGNVNLLTELGYQRLFLDKIADAEIAFRSACNVDESNFDALCGLTLCKLKTSVDVESRQQIRQQLAYLLKLSDHKPKPLVLYMSALMADPKEQHISSVQLLEDATELHFQNMELFSIGVEYIRYMNPDFMLELCAELIRHTPAAVQKAHFEQTWDREAMHITIKHSLNILERILHVCPGHQAAMLTRAKVDFLCGEHSKAMSRLQHTLNVFGETFIDGHLLLAQILVEKKQYLKALDSLEHLLAHNFSVRDRPMYNLLKGIILRKQQRLSEAHQNFLLALQLTGGMSRNVQPSDYLVPSDSFDKTLNNSDKMTLYIELINILREMSDSQDIYESERILQSAIEEFSGTTEMGRLIIAHSQIMLKKCNTSKAISLLCSIKPDQPYYVQARTHLANIYLQHQKNRSGFSKCFKELVEVRPESKSYLMLGDAYLSIQETAMAIDAYRNAYKMCPSNALLAKELGQAYVKCHDYDKALKYYHDVIQSPDCSALKLDLAELFLKLKHFQNAISLLKEAGGHNITEDNLSELQLRTKQLLLLARVHEKSGNIPESLKTLEQARANQYIVQKRCVVDQSENIQEQYKILSKICLFMAHQAVYIKNKDLALNNSKECMKYSPNDIEILVSLAKLQMKLQEMDMCRNICLQILQIDNNNEAASVLMADVSFRKMEFENAKYHFSQLLLSQPCNWTALTRLIEVMKRFGTLSESLPFLQRAEQESAKYKNSKGLSYCNGLFEWYNGNLNSALRYFNLSRRDHVWGQQAKLNMIEICINPFGEIPNANDILETGDSGEFNESRLFALRTAERLLKEVGPRPGEVYENAITHRVLWNFLQMASKQKLQIESALKDFTELMQNEGTPLMVTVVYGIAAAFVQLKQIQRAKNQLKRIARLNWSYEDAEYLERSWLLLADIYINSNKFDVAETFVDRVLKFNKSCTKAYELAGNIAEKTQSYNDAAKCYEKAWKSCGRSKPHIGYKLALSNMKYKQYTNAVNICQQVVKLHPDYTIIRKDILEKCRNNLRF